MIARLCSESVVARSTSKESILLHAARFLMRSPARRVFIYTGTSFPAKCNFVADLRLAIVFLTPAVSTLRHRDPSPAYDSSLRPFVVNGFFFGKNESLPWFLIIHVKGSDPSLASSLAVQLGASNPPI